MDPGNLQLHWFGGSVGVSGSRSEIIKKDGKGASRQGCFEIWHISCWLLLLGMLVDADCCFIQTNI